MGRTCRSSHRRRMLVHLHPSVCPKASADNQSRSRRRMCRDLYFDEVLRKKNTETQCQSLCDSAFFFISNNVKCFISVKAMSSFLTSIAFDSRHKLERNVWYDLTIYYFDINQKIAYKCPHFSSYKQFDKMRTFSKFININ